MAQGHKRVSVNATGCGFDYPVKEMKYLILSFLCSGVESKRDVEFRHSTRNAGGKWGVECLNIRVHSAFPATCGMQREADKKS